MAVKVWCLPVQTDRYLERNKSDAFIDKEPKTAVVIDMFMKRDNNKAKREQRTDSKINLWKEIKGDVLGAM